MQKGIENTFTMQEFQHDVSFTTMNSKEQVIEWMEKILVPNLYPLNAYNGDALNENEQTFVGGVNKR